jgi:formate hydrogenlyase transcriptional activator
MCESETHQLPLLPLVINRRIFSKRTIAMHTFRPSMETTCFDVILVSLTKKISIESWHTDIHTCGLTMTSTPTDKETRRLAKLEHDHQLLHEQLEKANEALTDSEERFRDLFDEAPIAYVHEDLDSRFIRANRTALRILGLTPEEAIGMVGKTLVADTPAAQRDVQDALDSIGHGTDTSGVVLEMRRKDNGEPVWIQWWSRPAPDGSYTRTMFIDITERVLLEREKTRLEAHNTYLQEEIHTSHFAEIVGDTAQMQQVFADVEQVAPTAAAVLILGETGTGKELIARAVHKVSKRAERPLIKVNCSALPAALIESELFGHEKGAFTGATTKRAGRFSLADGGSIFLDEIGDLPIELQAKLLRVLQEGEFELLGSSETCHVDVRVIAATNRDLFEATQTGEFREDLYFRLAVFPMTLPPLRDRLGDLPRLASLFARKFAEKLGRESVELSEVDVSRLSSYSWPGNVRELQNVIERALITTQDGALNLDRALPESASGNGRDTESPEVQRIRTIDQVHQMERDNLRLALDTAGWQVSGQGGAAELLGMNAATLSSRIKVLGIQRPD